MLLAGIPTALLYFVPRAATRDERNARIARAYRLLGAKGLAAAVAASDHVRSVALLNAFVGFSTKACVVRRGDSASERDGARDGVVRVGRAAGGVRVRRPAGDRDAVHARSGPHRGRAADDRLWRAPGRDGVGRHARVPSNAGRPPPLWRLGCTRFDIVEAELDSGYRISNDLPPHVAASMTSSVIPYLAIRHHVGFLAELGELDWEVLVYEGGETESVARLDEALADLAELCEFDIRAAVDFRDGEGASRPWAVVVRR